MSAVFILLTPISLLARETGSDDETIPANPAQEAALLRVAGPGAAIKQLPHFLIAYNTDRSLVNELTTRLRQTYRAVYRFCRIIGFEARIPDGRLEVFFFDERQQYDHYAKSLAFPSEGTYGFYHELTNRLAFFNVHNDPELLALHASVDTARASLTQLEEAVDQIKGRRTPIEVQFEDGRRVWLTKSEAVKEVKRTQRELKSLDLQRAAYCDQINYTVIQHEVAHQVLFNAGVHVRCGKTPKWLIEGMACLFETPPDPTGAGFATINQLRLKNFRSVIAGTTKKRRLNVDDYLKAVADGRMVSLDRLIADDSLFETRGARGAMIYAAAWSLTHYLQRVHTEQLAAYLKVVASRSFDAKLTGPQERSLFEAHFGPIDQTFSKRFGKYILKLSCRALPTIPRK